MAFIGPIIRTSRVAQGPSKRFMSRSHFNERLSEEAVDVICRTSAALGGAAGVVKGLDEVRSGNPTLLSLAWPPAGIAAGYITGTLMCVGYPFVPITMTVAAVGYGIVNSGVLDKNSN